MLPGERRVSVSPRTRPLLSTPAAPPIAALSCWGSSRWGLLHVDGVMLTQASIALGSRLAIFGGAGLSGGAPQALTRPSSSAPRKPLLAPFCLTPGQAAARCVSQLPGGSGGTVGPGKSGILAGWWHPHETFSGINHALIMQLAGKSLPCPLAR